MRASRIVLGGTVASFAMDVVQAAWTLAFERRRNPDLHDEETDAIVSVVKFVAPLVPGDLARTHPRTMGRAVHYVFGCAFAFAYASLRARAPKIALGNGTAFGVALWLASDVILIPAARLGRRGARYSRTERLNALASHLAYGIGVETIVRERA